MKCKVSSSWDLLQIGKRHSSLETMQIQLEVPSPLSPFPISPVSSRHIQSFSKYLLDGAPVICQPAFHIDDSALSTMTTNIVVVVALVRFAFWSTDCQATFRRDQKVLEDTKKSWNWRWSLVLA